MSLDHCKILALDTAMYGIGVGVCNDGEVFTETMDTQRGQAEHLIPMVEAIVARAGLEYSDIDALVTTVGPGTFTGLRIGLSAAKSLALALEIPLYGITTLQALALQYAGQADTEIGVLVETKRSDYYFQIFDAQGLALGEAMALEAGDIHEIIKDRSVTLIGDAVGRFTDGAEVSPLERINAGFIARALTTHAELFTTDVEPLYLRGADVSVSKRVQRVLGD